MSTTTPTTALEEDEKRYTCSLCQVNFRGWGNNPDPLGEWTQRCCDACNAHFVLPARLGIYTREQVDALRWLASASVRR